MVSVTAVKPLMPATFAAVQQAPAPLAAVMIPVSIHKQMAVIAAAAAIFAPMAKAAPTVLAVVLLVLQIVPVPVSILRQIIIIAAAAAMCVL